MQPCQFFDARGQFGLGGAAQCLDVAWGGCRMRRSACREPVARPDHPVGFRFQKGQRACARYVAGKTQPHAACAAHRKRDAACTAGLAEDDFTQQGVLQFGFQYGLFRIEFVDVQSDITVLPARYLGPAERDEQRIGAVEQEVVGRVERLVVGPVE